ncbi:MAG: riboflavin synthase [Gammaproteobacteria bacterium]|nr:MAG: riboflavin synthase [Gammaproteobacteria bacterium]
MFTGIIQAVGTIDNVENKAGDIRIEVDSAELDLNNIQPGDSIAVNGVCLTVIACREQGFSADISIETLNKTNLGELESGSPVNLENALTLNTVLGGHLVSGHVDGIASIIEMQDEGRSIRYGFEVIADLQHYIAHKGSVTIDGTSLTVNRVTGNRFEVNIVPHTQQKTIFRYYRANTRVNIEVDIIARYLERLIEGKAQGQNHSDRQMLDTLVKSGFIQK